MRDGSHLGTAGKTKLGMERFIDSKADREVAKPAKDGFFQKAAVALVLVLGLTVIGGSASAADGDLDPSFDEDGKVTTDFDIDDGAYSLTAQRDGKLVAAGYANSYEYRGGFTYTNGSDFALVRYNTDGSLDESFDTDGKVATDFGDGTYARAYALALQPNGTISKLVAAGYADGDFTLVRYNTDGSLDEDFGTEGKVTTVFGDYGSIAYTLTVQRDGKILAAGNAGGDFALARYNADGSPDEDFGTEGKVTTDFGGSDTARALTVRASGKIAVAGYSDDDLALARYEADGSPDESFGNENGEVVADLGDIRAFALTFQSDNKVLAAGSSDVNQETDFALARYNADGSLDEDFGTGGNTTTDFDLDRNGDDYDHARALAIQPDGRIVAAGESFGAFALARYKVDGSIDKSFGGGDGKVSTYVDNHPVGSVYALTVQSDNRLVAAGSSGNNAQRIASYDFTLARYDASAAPVDTNPAPVARDDSYEVARGKTLRIPTRQGVLDNDKGKNLSAEVAREPKNGRLTLNEDGSFTYKPRRGFEGRDTFTYRATDGTAKSKAATVTIRVKEDREKKRK